MNTQGCAPGWFRDEVMRARDPGARCESPVDAFVGVFVCIVVVKVFGAGLTSWQWMERRAHFRRASMAVGVAAQVGRARELRNRRPVVPLLWWGMIAVEVTWLVLVAYDGATLENGASPVLFGLGFGIWAIGAYLLFSRYVKLGRRIIPLSRTTVDDVPSSTSSSPSPSTSTAANTRLDELAREDLLLRVFARTLIGSNVVQAVLFCMACPALVGMAAVNTQVALVRVGSAVNGLYCLVLGVALMYQVNRCREATRQIYADAVQHNAQVSKALRRMRLQQVMWALTMSPACVVAFLLAGGVIPWSWAVLLFWLGLDALVTMYSTLFLAARVARRRRRKGQLPTAIATATATTLPRGDTYSTVV